MDGEKYECLVYSSGQIIVNEINNFQFEYYDDKEESENTETESNRRKSAKKLQQLTFKVLKQMIKSLPYDSGSVEEQPFRNNSPVDEMLKSNLLGNMAVECKRHIKTKSETITKSWALDRIVNRFSIVEKEHGLPIKFRVCIVTKKTWFDDVDRYLASNRVYVVEIGAIGTIPELKQAEIKLQRELWRILVFQDDLLNSEGQD